jgi:molybdopterin synthase sulfur carrier subunit
MKVSFYATLRPLVGAKTVDIPHPGGATLRSLVREIVARFPALGPKLFTEHGELAPGIHVFVNGRGAGYLRDGLDTIVTPEDVIDVFPAVAGG